jgi:predicted ATP-binding protein involved in virulence
MAILKKMEEKAGMVNLKHLYDLFSNKYVEKQAFVYAYFKAYRRIRLKEVKTVTQDSIVEGGLNGKRDPYSSYISSYNDVYTSLLYNSVVNDKSDSDVQSSQYFKQYLVNKKVHQAFDQLDNNRSGSDHSQAFFDSFTQLLKTLFDDDGLQLIFVRQQFEFFIALSDGRKITFNQLSEGFSAFLSIMTELFMEVDIIRRRIGDYSLDPPGIVLIDEPEVHLHLEMQYQVLPVLTKLFPNIQFIAATHSPAVISSIPNATIYDLSSQITRKEQVAGSSFSELMLTHFGLENEFSPVADRIIEQVNEIIENVQDKQAAKAQLQQLLEANREVLTPSLQLELESAILELEND